MDEFWLERELKGNLVWTRKWAWSKRNLASHQGVMHGDGGAEHGFPPRVNAKGEVLGGVIGCGFEHDLGWVLTKEGGLY